MAVYYAEEMQSNMLVDAAGYLRVCDFGFTAISGSETLARSRSGYSFGKTVFYCAPELLLGESETDELQVNTRRTDVYAFGMSILEVCASTDLHQI